MRKSNTEITMAHVHVIKASDEGFTNQLHALAALFHGTTPWYQPKAMQGKPQSRRWTTERYFSPQA
jgi:hypothetical protein